MPRAVRQPLSFPDPEAGEAANPVRSRPRSEVNLSTLTTDEVVALFRGEKTTSAGAVVSIESAMRVAVAYRCTHIIAGACGNLPIDVYRRVGEARQPAVGHPLRQVLQRPNGWQTSAEFRKQLTAHAVLKGNGYALKLYSRGRIVALWPLNNPDRMEVKQDPATMRLVYTWARPDGTRLQLDQADVLHLRGLTLDGFKGIGVVSHARQALGLSLQAEEAAARTFSQGIIAGLVFSKSGELSAEAFDRLRDQLSEREGVAGARKALILEDDLKVDGSLMSAEDLQFLETRNFTRSDVGMFFGVPPVMYGDTEKASSWGTGVVAISGGFVTYTADDYFVMWEQALERDCLTPEEIAAGYYVRIQRQALLRGDAKARSDVYTQALQWGWMAPDEVRALEDLNPRPDGKGGDFHDPPNTAGGAPPPKPPPPPEAP